MSHHIGITINFYSLRSIRLRRKAFSIGIGYDTINATVPIPPTDYSKLEVVIESQNIAILTNAQLRNVYRTYLYFLYIYSRDQGIVSALPKNVLRLPKTL